MRPVAFDADEVVFRQGQPGDHLILVESGSSRRGYRLRGRERMPSVIGSGEVIGELSLVGDGRRTATVRAVESSCGWRLDRQAFEFLRVSGATAGVAAVAERIGRLAVERLDALSRRTATALPGEPRGAESRRSPPTQIQPGDDEAAHLPGVRFFEHFKPADIAEVVAGLPRLALARGELLASAGKPPPALWIVIRGAFESVIRARPPLAGCAWPVRDAGSGTAVCSARLPSPVRSRAEPASAPS